MSWRDAARRYFLDLVPVPNEPIRPMGETEAAIGTFGTFGTGEADENCANPDAYVSNWMDWQECAAIMEYDGEMTRVNTETAAAENIRLDERRIR